MSTPPIALKATGKVADAAVCMTEVRCAFSAALDSPAGGAACSCEGVGGNKLATACCSPSQLLPSTFLSHPPTGTQAAGSAVLTRVTLPPPLPQHKFHRVPVVDDAGKCVGIVTRTDIFWALVSGCCTQHAAGGPGLHRQ